MNVMTWLRNAIGLSSPSTQRADTAINMASEVADSSRSLREQLAPFQHENDPFFAIHNRRMMAERYEETEEFGRTPRVKP